MLTSTISYGMLLVVHYTKVRKYNVAGYLIMIGITSDCLKGHHILMQFHFHTSMKVSYNKTN